MCLVLSLNLMILPRSNIGRTKLTTTLLPSGGQQPGLVYVSASLTSCDIYGQRAKERKVACDFPRKTVPFNQTIFF